MRTPTRSALRLAACVLAGSLFAPAAARAVQTSASLIVAPDKVSGIANGDIVNVKVFVNNASSDTPLGGAPPPGPPPITSGVGATVNGTITVDFNCADCACADHSTPFTLSFMPGPAGGCASKAAAVTGCAGASVNQALITLAAGGLSIPPNESAFIAELKLVASVPQNPGLGPNGIQASTDVCGVQACQSPLSSPCVSCAAQGCTVTFPKTTTDGNCPHPCPNRITFNASRPDAFEFHAIIHPGAGFDAANNPFSVSLTNADGQVFDPGPKTLPVGALAPTGDGFKYRDSTVGRAGSPGGIALVEVTTRDTEPDAYRIDIQVYDDDLEQNTTAPDRATMTVQFTVGGVTRTFGPLEWTRRTKGWQLPKFP